MNSIWPRVLAHIPGAAVCLFTVVSVRNADGYPWSLPTWAALGLALLIGSALDYVITRAINTYFGFDDDDDDDGPDDDDPHGPIIVPDSPKELFEPVR